jgi:[acyl-carrier-protein] S-malonyltransferase
LNSLASLTTYTAVLNDRELKFPRIEGFRYMIVMPHALANCPPYAAFFPGQGSQVVGMGKMLSEGSTTAQDVFARAEKQLPFALSSLCFNGPLEALTLTPHAQPAILAVSCAAFFTACREGQMPLPQAAAGHSLGEYSALVAAGSLSLEDAVLLVHKRGCYMQEAVPSGSGKMVAVLGKELEEIESALRLVSDKEVDIANINAPGQVVVSGSVDGVNCFLEVLGRGKFRELQVSAPFHSRLMAPARDALAKDIDALSFTNPVFPVLSNWSAAPLTEASQVQHALKEQVCGRVRWIECTKNALGYLPNALGIEFGEGAVVSGLIKKIAPHVQMHQLGSVESFSALSDLLHIQPSRSS